MSLVPRVISGRNVVLAGEGLSLEVRHVSDVSHDGVECCCWLGEGQDDWRFFGDGHVSPCSLSQASHTSAPSRPREGTSMALARAQARTSAVEGPAATGLSSSWSGLMRLMAAGSKCV